MKALLAPAVLACVAAHGRGQSDARLLLDDWSAGKRLESNVDAQLYGRSGIGGGESTQFTRTQTVARYRLNPALPLSPSLGVDWTHIELSSGTRLPAQLDDLSLAAGSPLFGDEHFFGGGIVGLGYAGDQAFAADQAWYGKGNVFVGHSFSKTQTLLLAVDYDGNRTLYPDIPLPSIVYDWKVDDELELGLGFPTAGLDWNLTPQLKLAGEYAFPDTIRATLAYQFLPKLAAELRYLSDDDAFHTAASGAHDRLFYEDQRFEIGLIATVWDDLRLSPAVGYGWDRKFRSGFDDRDSDHVAELASQLYLRLGFDLAF